MDIVFHLAAFSSPRISAAAETDNRLIGSAVIIVHCLQNFPFSACWRAGFRGENCGNVGKRTVMGRKVGRDYQDLCNRRV